MNARDRVALNLSFTVTGATTVLLGAVLPHLSARHGLSDAQAGRLFLAQFLCSTAGALLLGWAGRRWPPKHCLALSYLATGAGVMALGYFPAAWSLACVALYGLGLGVCNPAANLLAGQASPGRESAELNLLNMSWSLGAVLAPPLLSELLAHLAPGPVLAGLGALGIAASLASASLAMPLPPPVPVDDELSPPPRTARAAAWPAALFLFLYVGAESILSGWLPTHSYRNAGVALGTMGIPQAAFWAAILGGRLFASLRPDWLTPARWISHGVALALAGMLVLLAAARMESVLAGAVLAGAGMAPLFPAAVAVFQRRAREASPRLIGYVFAAGGCGGAVFPWLVGVVSTAAASLRIALLIAFVSALGLLLAAQRLRPETAFSHCGGIPRERSTAHDT